MSVWIDVCGSRCCAGFFCAGKSLKMVLVLLDIFTSEARLLSDME